MKDRKLMCVTQIMDDETGIWAGDMVEQAIYVENLKQFLKTYKESGKKALLDELDFLKKDVERYWEEIKK